MQREITFPRGVLLAMGLIFLLRLWLALKLPLAFDEAYYWTWSKHLAGGYYDHPPMVALLIHFSTWLFGDTQLGVRVLSVLCAIPTTWLVWRTALILFQDNLLAARAAFYLNLTILVSVGTVIVTPDAPLLLATALTIYCLARLWQTQNARWWLAIGAALGLALVSKYTAFFTGFSIFLWLLWVPPLRRWLLTPWPYAAGMLSLAIFSPVIVWNAQHGYASFAKQFGRAVAHGFSTHYEPELLGVLFGLLTPPIFVLSMMGLWQVLKRRDASQAARALMGALVFPLLGYFLLHALHARVQGNWLMPLFPALAIVAAWAASHPQAGWIARAMRWLAAPMGMILFALLSLHTLYPPFHPSHPDDTSMKLGFGFDTLAPQIEKLQTDQHATAILTSSYANTGWLSFYLPDHPLVMQVTEPLRWVNFALPDVATMPGPFLYVSDTHHDAAAMIGKAPQLLATLPRMAHGTEVESFRIYRIDALKTDRLIAAHPYGDE